MDKKDLEKIESILRMIEIYSCAIRYELDNIKLKKMMKCLKCDNDQFVEKNTRLESDVKGKTI